MEIHRIGIISDTHGLLRPEVEAKLKSCEIILHAGDIDRPEVLEKLKAIAPVCAVRGNADREMADLPEEREMELFGFRFVMVHNRKHIREDLTGIEGVIYGHSHKYDDFHEEQSGMRYLNPGSCGPKRFRLPITMMILTLYPEEHRMEAERIDCIPAVLSEGKQENAGSAGGFGGHSEGENEKAELSEKDMYRLVKDVMRGVKGGKSISEIAARNRAEEKLVEDICRMYVTHPGVDVDGIMDRLERRGL